MPGNRPNDTERRLLNRWSRPANLPPTTLRAITVSGNPGLRGIRQLKVEFRYPLSVICGRNGCGKTTTLTLAALGYHTVPGHFPRGARLSAQTGRASAYYTFMDFFYKGPSDPDITGVTIAWEYAGVEQISITKRSEKWMHYERRPERAVHYLGVTRALPAIEQGVLRQHFHTRGDYSDKVDLNASSLQRLSDIMGRPYRAADELYSRNYSLRTCRAASPYSSFNMGAGEDILIDILGTLQEAPNGSMIVIEEIELGLHPHALACLARHMQEIITEKDLQIIVSTHSREFVDSVPRQARILLQPGAHEHTVIHSPTTRFAMHDLTGRAEPEMVIYCEDDVACCLIEKALSYEQRRRVDVRSIGSNAELARQAFSHVRSGLGMKHLVIWDGDVSQLDTDNWLGALPREGGRDLIEEVSYTYLPGTVPPERWLATSLDSDFGHQAVAQEFELDSVADAQRLVDSLVALAEHHNIPHEAAQTLSLDKSEALTGLAKSAKAVNEAAFLDLRNIIGRALGGEVLRGRP